MKKLLTVLLAMLTVIWCCSCGKEDSFLTESEYASFETYFARTSNASKDEIGIGIPVHTYCYTAKGVEELRLIYPVFKEEKIILTGFQEIYENGEKTVYIENVYIELWNECRERDEAIAMLFAGNAVYVATAENVYVWKTLKYSQSDYDALDESEVLGVLNKCDIVYTKLSPYETYTFN